MTFTYEEIVELIKSELEYPTPWPPEQEQTYKDMGVSYQMSARAAVACTKESLLERLAELSKKKS